ncbi:MAG: hypothetical protein DYG92_05770 [Leptolyngbya sp. PLA1]|nr:hypothetical protein [Leptolyngbya sp. PLA1]
MRAFRFAQARVRGEQPEPPRVARLTGVEVILRINNTPVARGQSWEGDGSLAAACDALLAELDRSLPPGRDVVEADHRASLIASSTMTMELAGAMVPIRCETFADAATVTEPGLDAIVVRKGEVTTGMLPLWMLGSGLDSPRALQACVASAAGDAAAAIPGVPDSEAGAASAKFGLTYYRARTSQIATLASGGEPVFLTRGGRVVPPSGITLPALRELADRVADHLCQRVWDDGCLGQYQYLTGNAQNADADDAALTAYVLAEYANWRGASDQARSARAAAMTLVQVVLRDPTAAAPAPVTGFKAKEAIPSAWGNPAAEALSLLAIRELLAGGETPRVDETRLARLDTAVSGRFGNAQWDEKTDPRHRGVVALALAARAVDAAQASPAEVNPAWEQAQRAVRSVFRETPPEKLVAQMPWLGLAELMLAGPGDLPASIALREMREQCWRVQVGGDEPDALDLAGGLVLSGEGARRPTWQSLRPLSFLARMLADERLTGDEDLLPQLARVVAGARFARQLAADEAVTSLALEPARAAWGIRAATWDAHQPVDASAMGLLTLRETVDAIDAAGKRLAARRKAQSPR